MAMIYRTRLRPTPLPLEARTAAAMSRHHAAAIAAAGGRTMAARAAIDALLARGGGGPANERSRLHRLFAQVYTREELETLMLDTYGALGLGD
jgi:hypothetical protein